MSAGSDIRPEETLGSLPPDEGPRISGARAPLLRTAVVFVGLLVALEIVLRLLEPQLPLPLDWPIGNMQAKYEQMTALAEGGEEANIVFVGSSVVFDGINPLILTEAYPDLIAYNAGIAGAISTRAWRWWTTEVVIPRLDPERVVIGVASVDLNSGDADTFWGPLTRARGFNRVNAGNEGSIGERLEQEAEEWWTLFRLRTVLREPVRVLVEFGNQSEDDLAMGPFGAEARTEEPDPYELTEEGERRIRNGQLADYELQGEDLIELESLVADLKADGLEVILVNMPVTDDFVNLHPDGEQDYSEYLGVLEGLAKSHGTRFLDFGREFDSVDLFRDPSHLNYEGADQFSRLLASTLIGDGG